MARLDVMYKAEYWIAFYYDIFNYTYVLIYHISHRCVIQIYEGSVSADHIKANHSIIIVDYGKVA